MPRSRSASSVAIVAPMSRNIAVSVISKVRSCGSMPASCDLGHDLVDEAGLLELERRQVDAQLERFEAGQAMPFDDLSRGRLEDRPAEGEDRAVLLGEADELGRVDRPARRVVPADERLDADDPAAGEDDDRLVGDGQVAPADASTELGGQRVALDDRAVHGRIEDLRPALAVRLGAVHRDVGVAQHLVDRRSPGRTALTPALQPTMTSVPWIWNGSSSAVMIRWVMRQRIGHGRAGDREQGELVATEPGDHVARPQLFDDPLGDRDQQLVAGGMALRVVDDLEVVEVEEDDDRRLVRLARERDPQLDLVRRRPAGWAGPSASRGRPGAAAPP